jgi:protein involved in polysaccharide export with SLBB domain
LDWQQRPFNVALLASLSFDGVLTYKVEYTPDNPQKVTPCYITRSGTTATMTLAANHGLSVGDSVTVINSGDPNLNGTYPVASVPSANTLTYTVAATGLTTALPQAGVVLMRVFPHDYMVNLTARADGNFAFPISACRVTVTAYTAGSVTLEIMQGHARG